MHQGVPGSAGIIGIIVGTIAVSVLVSAVTGIHGHWPFALAGIVIGVWAVQAISK